MNDSNFSISLGAVGILFWAIAFAALACLAGWAISRVIGKLDQATKNDCPWYLAGYSWAKRHAPLVGLVLSLLGILFVYRYLPHITYWANNAQLPASGQEMLDGNQIVAEQQAGGAKQFGAIATTFLGGTFYFSSLLFGVWSLMGYIFPAVPAWAKREFSSGFAEYESETYDVTRALSTGAKYAVKLVIFFGLLWTWAGCLYVAAQVQ